MVEEVVFWWPRSPGNNSNNATNVNNDGWGNNNGNNVNNDNNGVRPDLKVFYLPAILLRLKESVHTFKGTKFLSMKKEKYMLFGK